MDINQLKEILIFHKFDLRVVVQNISWSKDSKTVPRIKTGWFEVVFYNRITDGQTDRHDHAGLYSQKI